METPFPLVASNRSEWRAWLADHFENEKEVWLVFPKKASGEQGMSYNDAVEEALCFGWIDSTVRTLNGTHKIQRFTPRRSGSRYSQSNIERLVWLESHGMLYPGIRESVLDVIRAPYVYPEDILARIRSDDLAWANYQRFPAAYRRIRIAYIDGARGRPAEFARRLESFIRTTVKGRMMGYGGIDKYFEQEKTT